MIAAYWPHAVQKVFLDALLEWVLRAMLVGVLKPLKNKGFKDW